MTSVQEPNVKRDVTGNNNGPPRQKSTGSVVQGQTKKDVQLLTSNRVKSRVINLASNDSSPSVRNNTKPSNLTQRPGSLF